MKTAKQKAMEALSDIWNDNSLPMEVTLLILEELRDEIEDRIATLVEDMGQ